MVSKKDVMIVILSTFCLTATLFMIIPTRSTYYQGTASGNEQLFDIEWRWIPFPIRMIWETIFQLQSKADSLNASVLELLDKVDILNTSLIELQSRINTTEEKLNQMKTIRFFEPNETINTGQTYKDGAVFVWTPNNSTSNAILSIRCYFRYRSEPSSGGIAFRIVINDETVMSFAWLHSAEYRLTPTIADFDSSSLDNNLHFPNQNNYTIRFQFGCETTGFVKDINIIIEVIDGLSASN